MNNLKVIKKALRQLAQKAGGGDAAGADGAGPAITPEAVQQLLGGLKLGKLGKGGGKAGGKGGGGGGGKAGGGRKGAGMLLAAAALGGSALADAAPGASPLPAGGGPVGVVEETIVYKQTDRGPLQLHVFRPTSAAPATGHPCMVFFHGGGWRRGSTNQFRAFGTLLASYGVIGMSAEYRLMETEERLIPTEAIEDARSAMRFVRKNAARLGCDLGRIGAGGGSAGGHLAMMTALKSPVDDPKDDLSVDPRPAALIVLNGPVNFDAYESPIPVEARRAYAPYYLIDRHFPPTLMMHGTHDKVIPITQVIQFRDKAAQLGVNVKLVAFEGRGHGFFNKGKGQPGDWERASAEMIAFLRGLGWVAH